MSFWIKQNFVRPNHECERGCAVLIEQSLSFSSLCVFRKKLSLILCLNELILVVDFKSDDKLFYIFLAPVGQAFLASVTLAKRRVNLNLTSSHSALLDWLENFISISWGRSFEIFHYVCTRLLNC